VYVRTIIPLDESTLSRIHWLVKAEHLSLEDLNFARRRLLPVAPLMTAGGAGHGHLIFLLNSAHI
jgi:hypothetical protein